MTFSYYGASDATQIDKVTAKTKNIKGQINSLTAKHGLPTSSNQQPSGLDATADAFEESLGMSVGDLGKVMTNLMFPKKECSLNDDNCESKKKTAVLGSRYAAAMKKYKKAKTELDGIVKEKEQTGAARQIFIRETTLKGEVAGLKMMEEHTKLKDSVQQSIYLLQSQEHYGEQTLQLMDGFAEGIVELEEDINGMEAKNRVNNRKAYYEIQQINILRDINWWLIRVYWAMVIILVCIELYQYARGTSHSSQFMRIGYGIFMICYPFIMNYIVQGLMYILNLFFGRIPDNVYMS